MLKEKVVYFSPNGYLGGAERFVLEAAIGHQKFGQYDVTVLFFNDGPGVSIFKQNGINCLVLKNTFKLTHPLKLFKAIKEIRSLQRRHQWKVINATMPYAHIVASLAFPFHETLKKIWYQHGPVGGKLDLIASFFPYNKILFNSSYTQSAHESQPLFYCDPSKHFLCPYGIPKTDVQVTESPFPSRHQRTILTAGRICSWKGYETSLKALSNIFKNYPLEKKRCHLYIAGDVKVARDQKYYDDLQDLTRSLNLTKNVTFLGRREDLHVLMNQCDLYLHTSNIPEPFGLVVAEAMIQRAFVIGTNKGGTPDMLINKVTGLSFDSIGEGASRELEENLLHAFNLMDRHPHLFHQIRENGYRLICQKFNVPDMIKNLENYYE